MSDEVRGPAADETPSRAFICYSHDDFDLARAVCERLEQCGLSVKWDQAFTFGRGFHDQIRMGIACAHLFVPVLTERAIARGWVQQEIGYAAAMNIPVLPVGVGVNPGEMIGHVHAVKVDRGSFAPEALERDGAQPDPLARVQLREALQRVLERELNPRRLTRLIEQFSDTALARYEVAELHEERSQLIAQYAETAWDLLAGRDHGQGGPGRIRQLGGLSSFHIPLEDLTDRLWQVRYGLRKHSTFHWKLQRQERLALSRHLPAGARLIINPYHTYTESGPRAYAARLMCLLRFLQESLALQKAGAPGGDVQIVIDPELGFHMSETSIGNCFTATALSGSSSAGYQQTVFTTHGPSMRGRLTRFDNRFAQLLHSQRQTELNCLVSTIAELRRILVEFFGIAPPESFSGRSIPDLVSRVPEAYVLVAKARVRRNPEWIRYCKDRNIKLPWKPAPASPSPSGSTAAAARRRPPK